MQLDLIVTAILIHIFFKFQIKIMNIFQIHVIQELNYTYLF